MPYRLPPERGYERSTAQLSRAMLNNPLRDFLRDLAKRDRVEYFFDFGDWGDAANFTMAQTQTSTNFTVIDGAGGTLAGTTANTTTANISAIYKTRVLGNANPDVEFRWKVSTIAATYIVETGFVDAAPATGASFVTDIDTAGATAASWAGTNGTILGIWTNQTHANFAFASIGSFTGQTVTTTLLTTSNSPITAAAADTYVTCRVLLLTDPDETGKTKAYAWINGKLVGRHALAAGAVNGQSALYPWFYFQNPSATGRVATLDYMRIAHDRSPLQAAME